MIALGSDHGGFMLKRHILNYLEQRGIPVRDFGCYNEESVDYPVYASEVARAVAAGVCERGILCCGTGLGVCIAANKIKGVRAVTCSESYSAAMSRRHNNANVLCLGGRVIGPSLAEDIADVWLNTEFEGGRHARRVDMITALEERPHPTK
jgi:ribose 5-phosphate isomerase B